MNESIFPFTARLLLRCQDRPGIIAAVSGFFAALGANITALDQHATQAEGGVLFLRLEFQHRNLQISRERLIESFTEQVATPFSMEWTLRYANEHQKIAIMVSKHDHALLELLWRWSRHELAVDLPLVVSNHPDLAKAVTRFGVRYVHADEKTSLALFQEEGIDCIVLARYMQILSPAFVAQYPNRIINIHHSFLPAFVGADPYRQAYERGVKLIGATAHYVTDALDMGPIIDQDVLRIYHDHTVEELREFGRDIERMVLARAIKWHLESRIIVHENKTIVFM